MPCACHTYFLIEGAAYFFFSFLHMYKSKQFFLGELLSGFMSKGGELLSGSVKNPVSFCRPASFCPGFNIRSTRT